MQPNITPQRFRLHAESQGSCPRSPGYSGLGKSTSWPRRQIEKFGTMLHFGRIKTTVANRRSCSMSEIKYLWNFHFYGKNPSFTCVMKLFSPCTIYCKSLNHKPMNCPSCLTIQPKVARCCKPAQQSESRAKQYMLFQSYSPHLTCRPQLSLLYAIPWQWNSQQHDAVCRNFHSFCHESIIISWPAAVADIQLLLHLLTRQGNFKPGSFHYMNVCVCVFVCTAI